MLIIFNSIISYHFLLSFVLPFIRQFHRFLPWIFPNFPYSPTLAKISLLFVAFFFSSFSLFSVSSASACSFPGFSISSCRLERATRYREARGGSEQLFLLGFHSVDRSFAHNWYKVTRGWGSSPLLRPFIPWPGY